uniref:Uncharacterized protein n=1 Tax=Romanomermis culicivorax TaxID=13658 RepID=A0A915HWH5_ROMCU
METNLLSRCSLSVRVAVSSILRHLKAGHQFREIGCRSAGGGSGSGGNKSLKQEMFVLNLEEHTPRADARTYAAAGAAALRASYCVAPTVARSLLRQSMAHAAIDHRQRANDDCRRDRLNRTCYRPASTAKNNRRQDQNPNADGTVPPTNDRPNNAMTNRRRAKRRCYDHIRCRRLAAPSGYCYPSDCCRCCDHEANDLWAQLD